MKIIKKGIIFILLIPLLFSGNIFSNPQIYYTYRDSIADFYKNPLFDRPIADPTVLFNKTDQKLYAYGTSDSWADKKGVRWIPIVSSEDGVVWKYIGNAFSKPSKPNWKEGGLWAPDIVKVGDLYHLYYSVSNWHDPDPSIGVAVAISPTGPFEDKGKLLSTLDIDVPNSIDPFFYEEENNKYLFWGSFSRDQKQGTYGVKLTNDGLQILDKAEKFKIAAGDWEAVVIHKREGYYYMFGSKGTCCDGADSKYHVLVGRSKSLFGPYLDKNGKNIAERGNGTIVLKGNKKLVGPGHTSRIFTDISGKDWIFYHAIEPSNSKLSNGVNRRLLCMDQVNWIDGWPLIHDGTPSNSQLSKPKFN